MGESTSGSDLIGGKHKMSRVTARWKQVDELWRPVDSLITTIFVTRIVFAAKEWSDVVESKCTAIPVEELVLVTGMKKWKK
ncbi:hypothetical protein GCK72_000642 [Caenorhabditis remanei]|uniref:Uncharacterized protein n=1 Tax=Caenorhabditis remanei TaxID=31234 RepID=A0A6A5HMJ2_CAERE|nr:hypothetical protein GCK72_000642 [Caenorhabditis remanei]KAF1768829.1 hypothetical protein GCK72_000642 [Caenorhabditis remanei]